MQKFLTIFLLHCSLSCFPQSDYDLFESYNTELLKKQIHKVKSVTGFRNLKDGVRKVTSYKEFSAFGLPTKIVQYDENSNELKTIECIYNNLRQPTTINTSQKGKKVTTSQFSYDSTQSLNYVQEYVYSSFDGKKMLLWKTDFEYYENKKLKTITKMEVSDILPKRDTVEMLFFDTSGVKTKHYFNMAGHKHHFIYRWNQDKTEMKEYDYSGDSIQSTIVHKYKGEYEVERVERDSEKPLVFWKYDKENRLIQTNSALYFIQDLIYDTKGYLIKESWTATLPELVKGSDSKIMRLTYEYKFWK